jgi:four helix bundle protein
MDDFRFEKLDIWNDSIELSDVLFDYCDKADNLRLYKFAEQLRAAAMSISNNIASPVKYTLNYFNSSNLV